MRRREAQAELSDCALPLDRHRLGAAIINALHLEGVRVQSVREDLDGSVVIEAPGATVELLNRGA